jgi:hemoglobin
MFTISAGWNVTDIKDYVTGNNHHQPFCPKNVIIADLYNVFIQIMEFTITHYEFGERPPTTIPDPSFLTYLTEEGMRKMVSDHYDLLKQSNIKELFPQDDKEFEAAKRRSSDFFIQICGGPDYFNQNRGKPMLSSRHAPFRITPQARMVWLGCYIQVLSKMDIPEPTLASFWNYINTFSNWMVNRPGV